jgi:hypothetical protein
MKSRILPVSARPAYEGTGSEGTREMKARKRLRIGVRVVVQSSIYRVETARGNFGQAYNAMPSSSCRHAYSDAGPKAP